MKRPPSNSSSTIHNSHTPKLRFPEFRDAGPWEVRTIEELSERITQGGTPNTSVSAYWNGDIAWITPAEMGDDAEHHYTDRTLRSLSAEGLRNSSAELLPVNSVIISSRAPIGFVTINKVEMATNQGCKGIVPKKGVYHEFLYFSLLNSKSRLHDLGAGAGFKEISAATLRSFQVPVPLFREQQKIADCLSSLDELITVETQKLDALKAHKKGLMQQLFPEVPDPSSLTTHHSPFTIHNSRIPKLRFPEFRNAGPWEVKRLCDLLKYERPEPYIVESDTYSADGTPVLTANKSFVLGYTSEQHGIYQEVPAIIFDDFTTDKKYVDFPFKIKSSAIKILKHRGNNNIRFLFELMNLIPYDPTQHKRHYISAYQKIPVRVPGPAEQRKIADCLSSLDELIDLQTRKIELLQAHKKGLMQQLFPQEVSA